MDKLYQVRGCSMMPTLADGDIIEVVAGQWQDGDIVVARVGSKNVVKRAVGDKLVGDNTEVSAIFSLHDAIILGRIEKKLHRPTNDHLLRTAEASIKQVKLSRYPNSPMSTSYGSEGELGSSFSIDKPIKFYGADIIFCDNSNNTNKTVNLWRDSDHSLIQSVNCTIQKGIFTTYKVDFIPIVLPPGSYRLSVNIQSYSHMPKNAPVIQGGVTFNTDSIYCATGIGIYPQMTESFGSTIIDQIYYESNSDPVISVTNPATNQLFSTAPGRKTITISGTVRDADNNNITINAAINGKTKSTIISNTSTAKAWSLTWDVSADNIVEGSYSNILVTADDGMGGIATATMGYILTVDRTAPAISISGVANGQTYQNSVTPSFSATDAGGAGFASVAATLNGVSYTSGTAITSAGGQVLVVTATDYAGNQSQQSVNFTVNKAPVCSLFSPATNQTLAEGQGIVVTENRFTVRITPDDANAGDMLQYKVIQSGVIKVDWQNCSRGSAFDYTFTNVLLGNNVCQVLVRDDKGGQVTRTFTVRNKATGSAAAALSQKGVREVLLALGYPGTAYSCLNDLKPSGYTGPLSFSGIINFLS